MIKNDQFNKNSALIRKKIHPLYLKLMDLVEKKNIVITNPEKLQELELEYFSKGIPVSFCANHTNAHDIPLAAKTIKNHFYVMIAREGLTFIQKLAFIINGPIFIKRDDQRSRKDALQKLIDTQNNGYCTLVYPEAAWNVTENKLMNKLYNGIVEASKQTGVHIVPLVFEYIDDVCYVKIGDPIKIYENVESRYQSDRIRDIMVEMRMQILEKNTNFYPERKILKEIESIADNWDSLPANKMKRLLSLYEELNCLKIKTKKEFYDKIEENWKECPGLDREFEASCVYKDEATSDEVFAHLDILEKNEKTAFLFKPNISGYRK